jgi:hypothetical protein
VLGSGFIFLSFGSFVDPRALLRGRGGFMSEEQSHSKTSHHERAKLLVKKYGAVSITECHEVWWQEPYKIFDIYETDRPTPQVFLVKKNTDKEAAHALIRQRYGLGEEVEIYVW